MKIAVVGSRGFLVNYGGYETFVHNLIDGLKDKGFEFTVYGISAYRNFDINDNYDHVKRVWLPSLPNKTLQKVLASNIATIHACLTGGDAILSVGVSPGLVLWIPRILGKKIFLNTDGIEWRRSKWSGMIAFFLRLCEQLGCFSSHKIVADSRAIAVYLKQRYKRSIHYIPYGSFDNSKFTAYDEKILAKYDLKFGSYYLQACRLEPENNAHCVIEEFDQYRGDKKLVIIGDTPHSLKYKKLLQSQTNHKIRLLGSIYGEEFKVILRNAYCYIHGHEAGGTNPVLLEAMASAKCPVVLNVPYNIEVIENCGLSFSKHKGDLAGKLDILDKDENRVKTLGQMAYDRVRAVYSWSSVILAYEEMFRKSVRHSNDVVRNVIKLSAK